MRKILFSAGLSCSCLLALAQQDPPVMAGLRLRLEAIKDANNFIPATATTQARWRDRSGMAHDVFSITPGSGNVPVFINNINGLGFNAIRFNGGTNCAMTNNGTSPTAFNLPNATIFIVRIANTTVQANVDPMAYQSMVSIAARNAGGFRSLGHEFGMGNNVALHHTWSGQFTYRDQQCFTSPSLLPSNRPVVLTGRFGQAGPDINYWVNDDISVNPVTPAIGGMPAASYPASVVRDWTIGGRYTDGVLTASQYFNGDIMEILVYNRQLTNAEVHDVNEYLECKYKVNYQSCNNSLADCPYCERNNDPTVTSSLSTTYLGAGGGGSCLFSATVNVSVSSGQNLIGFEWTLPNGSKQRTTGNTLASFSLPPNTPGGVIKVRVFTHNGSYTVGSGNHCCDFELSQTIWCGTVGSGGVH